MLVLAWNALQFADSDFKKCLKKSCSVFVDIISKEPNGQSIKGIKWDDLIVRTEWKVALISFFDSEPRLQNFKEEFFTVLAVHPCQFDEQELREALENMGEDFAPGRMVSQVSQAFATRFKQSKNLRL